MPPTVTRCQEDGEHQKPDASSQLLYSLMVSLRHYSIFSFAGVSVNETGEKAASSIELGLM